MERFAELPIHPQLKENLAHAKFVNPTPIQAKAIPPALAGNDVLGTAQTGTGKTLAFMIPIIEKIMHSGGKGIEALVILPTRELAMQVEDTCRRIGRGSRINSALVVGGLSEGRQIDAIRRGAQIVIATPGRLDDFIKRRMIDLHTVKILVLDEADRMVDMGFLPQMKSIMAALPSEKQTLCFSATLEKSVAHLVHQYLKNPVRVEVGSTQKPAENVALYVYEVSREQKLGLLTHLLNHNPGTFLIFTRTKHGADRLARKLSKAGIHAGVIHGDRSQSQRSAALHGFKQGRPRILVATDVAARGIHVHGISHVVNFDLPQVPEDFIHRVGRTGRAEHTGVASTFVTRDDVYDMYEIEHLLGKPIDRMPIPEGIPLETFTPRDTRAENAGRGFKRGTLSKGVRVTGFRPRSRGRGRFSNFRTR